MRHLGPPVKGPKVLIVPLFNPIFLFLTMLCNVGKSKIMKRNYRFTVLDNFCIELIILLSIYGRGKRLLTKQVHEVLT